MSLLLALSSSTTTYVISENTGADFGGVVDTYLLEGNPTANFGTSTRIGVKAWTTADREHSVIKFGGITSITEPTVVSVTLRLYCNAIGNDPFDLPTLNVFKLIRAFVETTATWNTPWGTAGALNTTNDYDNTLLGSVFIGAENAYYEVTGAALVSYVQAIVSGGGDDGLLLTESNYLAPLNQFKEAFFVSSNGTDGFRPELIVEMSGVGGGAIESIGATKNGVKNSTSGFKIATGVGSSRAGVDSTVNGTKTAQSIGLSNLGVDSSASGTKTAISVSNTKAGVDNSASGTKIAQSTGSSKLGSSANAIGQAGTVSSGIGSSNTGIKSSISGTKTAQSIGSSKQGAKSNVSVIKIATSVGAIKVGAKGSAAGVAIVATSGIGTSKVGTKASASGTKTAPSVGAGKEAVSSTATGFKIATGVGATRAGVKSTPSSELFVPTIEKKIKNFRGPEWITVSQGFWNS